MDLSPGSLLPRLVLGISLALILAGATGYWIAMRQIHLLIILAAMVVVAVVVAGMQRRAWLLIPFAWLLSGKTMFIPVAQFSVRDMAVLVAMVSWLAYHAFVHIRNPVRLRLLDWILFANFAWIGVTFMRNPVGFYSTGSANIGGRFYWDAFIAFLAYWIMVQLPDNPRHLLQIPVLQIAGTLLPTALSFVAYLSPSLTPLLYNLYNRVSTEFYLQWGQEVSRFGALGGPGVILASYLCARFNPVTMFNPMRLRSYLLALALVCVLVSGFRNFVLLMAVAVFIGAWLHGGWWDTFRVGVLGTVFLGLLLIGQGRLYELPHPMQRALTFLPGSWSRQAVEEARGSAEDRFQWWRDVLRYRMIKNWWVGDGFGVGRQDFELLMFSGSEKMLALGSYHSGPLTAIRKVGLIGLGLFYTLLILAARDAYRMARACRGSPVQTLAFYIAIPLLWYAVHYTFVFGEYAANFVEVVFVIAVLRLLQHAHETWMMPAVTEAPIGPTTVPTA